MRGEVLGPMRRMGEGGAAREREREGPSWCQSVSVARGQRRSVTDIPCQKSEKIIQLSSF